METSEAEKGAKKLKVWGYRVGGTARWIVATPTKKAAIEAMAASTGDFNNFGCETRNDLEIATALSKPGVVFTTPADRKDYVEGAIRWRRGSPWPPSPAKQEG